MAEEAAEAAAAAGREAGEAEGVVFEVEKVSLRRERCFMTPAREPH